MNQKIFINIQDLIFLSLIMATTIFVVGIVGISSDVATKVMSVLVDLLIIYGVYRFKKNTGTILNQYMLFWLSICVFTFGQVVLYSFGLTYDRFNLFAIYSRELINSYIVYALLGMLFLLMSGVVLTKNIKNGSEDKSDLYHTTDTSSGKIVFWCFFVISLPFYYIIMVKNIQLAYSGGYSEIYTTTLNPIIESFSMWYIPSCLGLIYSYKESKIKYLILAMMIIPVIGNLYIGGRSMPIAILVCLVCLWHTSIKQFTKRQIIIVLFLGLVVLSSLSTILIIRGSSERTLSDLASVFFKNGLMDGITSSLGEMGSTMQVWLRLQHIVPTNKGYALGFSYLASVLSCIPSFLLGGFSFARYSNLSGWITKIERSSYGLGFSTIGEAYYNFGWFGIPALFFVGYFIFTVLSGKWCKGNLQEYKTVFSSIALYIFATTGRGSMYLCIRYILYCIIIPMIIINMIEKRKVKLNVGK